VHNPTSRSGTGAASRHSQKNYSSQNGTILETLWSNSDGAQGLQQTGVDLPQIPYVFELTVFSPHFPGFMTGRVWEISYKSGYFDGIKSTAHRNAWL